MSDIVYVIRAFRNDDASIGIRGIYRTEDAAKQALLSDDPDLEFDYRTGRWIDKVNGLFYRIHAFTVN